jgi:hypothetical protein
MACAAHDARENLAVQSFSVVRGSKKITQKKSERLPCAKQDFRIVPIIDWNASKSLILHDFL